MAYSVAYSIAYKGIKGECWGDIFKDALFLPITTQINGTIPEKTACEYAIRVMVPYAPTGRLLQ
jgi:hypothetical protein